MTRILTLRKRLHDLFSGYTTLWRSQRREAAFIRSQRPVDPFTREMEAAFRSRRR